MNTHTDAPLSNEERRRSYRDRMYAELKNRAPELLNSAVEGANGVRCRYGLSIEIAADIEAVLVQIALRALR